MIDKCDKNADNRSDRQTDRRVAFLILGHKDPEMLKKLCKALDYDFFDIYVHIDKKCDISQFDWENYDLKYSKIFFLTNRIKVRWGDISIVDATLNLYKQASNNYDYCRYVTLSGLDFPIKSNDYLYKMFTEDTVEFIKGNPITESEKHKVENLYFWKLGKIGSVLSIVLKRLKIKKKSKLQINGKNADIYFAPQWHALSGEFIKYMFSVLEQNHIRNWFRYSYAPDELMIPTILFNCEKFRNRALACNFPDNTHYNEKTALHYLNYDPFIEVYDEKSFDKIINSDKMFVRKVTSEKSKILTDMILKKTHGNE